MQTRLQAMELEYSQEHDSYLMLAKSKVELKEMEGFSDDNWPRTANASFRRNTTLK